MANKDIDNARRQRVRDLEYGKWLRVQESKNIINTMAPLFDKKRLIGFLRESGKDAHRYNGVHISMPNGSCGSSVGNVIKEAARTIRETRKDMRDFTFSNRLTDMDSRTQSEVRIVIHKLRKSLTPIVTISEPGVDRCDGGGRGGYIKLRVRRSWIPAVLDRGLSIISNNRIVLDLKRVPGDLGAEVFAAKWFSFISGGGFNEETGFLARIDQFHATADTVEKAIAKVRRMIGRAALDFL